VSKKKNKKLPKSGSIKPSSRYQADNNTIGSKDPWLEWGLYTMVLLVPFLFFAAALDASALPRHIVIEVGGALLATLLLLRLSRSDEHKTIHIPLLACPVLGVLIMAVASNGWAHHHGSALIETVHLSGMVLLFFLTIYVTRTNRSFPLLLLRMSVVAGAAISCMGILQNFGWMEDVFFQAVPPAATMINKNICAQYLDTLIFPALFLVVAARNDKEAWRWSVAFCLILTMILISYTRGAWLGLVAGLVILSAYLMLCRPARRDVMAQLSRSKCSAVGVAVALAIVVMLYPSTINKGSLESKWQDAMQHPENGNAGFRLAVDQNTWRMFQDHPMGIGIGNWKHIYPPYSRSVVPTPGYNLTTQSEHLHNDPFVSFVELGWPGGLMFLSIFMVAVWSVWRIGFSAEVEAHNRLLVLALLIALADVGAHSLVSFPFHSPTSAMQIWLWLGVLAGMSWRFGVKTVSLGAIWWRGLAALMGLATVMLVLFNAAYFKSNVLIREEYVAQTKQQRTNCSLMDQVKSAREIFPYDFTVERVYGGTLYFCDHDRANALRAVIEELQQEPYYLPMLINISALAYQQKRFDLVKDVSERMIKIFPWMPDGYHGLGVLAWKDGAYKQAKAWFMQALAQDKHYAPSLDMLGKIPNDLNRSK